jgi:hypothetical protein
MSAKSKGPRRPAAPPGGGAAALPAPNAGELDVLAVLWQEAEGEGRLLQLSEVYRRVCERRRRYGEPEPALTTVSTHLRKLAVEKGLIEEVVPARGGGPAAAAGAPIRTRGSYRPPTRSPLTSYRARHGPAEVLRSTLYGLAEAYPPTAQRRLDALLDFAQVLGLPAPTLQKLTRLIEAERAAAGEAPAGR